MTSRHERGRFRLRLVLAGLLALVPAASLVAQDRGTAEEAYERAEIYRGKGDLRSARIEYMNAIKADPRWVEPRLRQANVYLGLEDGVAAETELNAALGIGADPADVALPMARAMEMQGRPADTIEWAGQAPGGAASEAEAARLIGRARLAMGDLPAAGAAFDRALRSGGESGGLWFDIARFRFAAADQPGAVAATQRAVDLDPDNIPALRFRGELMRAQFGLGSALPWFEQALAVDPRDVPVLLEYAATLGDLGRNAEMLAVTRRVLKIDPGNPRAFFLQAVLAARAGNYELAKSILGRTEGRLDGVPAVMLVGGVVEFELGNWNVASDRFRALLQRQPYNARAQELLARALERLADQDALLARFRPIADRSDAEPYLLAIVARALEAKGDYRAAAWYRARAAGGQPPLVPLVPVGDAAAIESAAFARPGDARAVIPYVRLLLANGNASAARDWAGQIRAASPQVPDAQILYGDAAFAAGDVRAALAAYERAGETRQSDPVMIRIVAAERALGDDLAAAQRLIGWLRFDPLDPVAARLLGEIYLDSGYYAEAASLLRRARARLGDGHPLLLADLALAELRAGNGEAAREAAATAYQLMPMNGGIAHVYGLTLAGKARRADSIALLEKAVAIQPGNGWYGYSLAQAYADAGNDGRAFDAVSDALATGSFPERDKAVALYRKLLS